MSFHWKIGSDETWLSSLSCFIVIFEIQYQSGNFNINLETQDCNLDTSHAMRATMWCKPKDGYCVESVRFKITYLNLPA